MLFIRKGIVLATKVCFLSRISQVVHARWLQKKVPQVLIFTSAVPFSTFCHNTETKSEYTGHLPSYTGTGLRELVRQSEFCFSLFAST